MQRRPQNGFTLIELILVMALLAIAAGLVAPRMISFYQGRTLSLEAQRLLSLTHYARSRAVNESMPMVLTLDTTRASYSLGIQPGYASEDPKEINYAVDSTLSMTVTASQDTPVSQASYSGTQGLGTSSSSTLNRGTNSNGLPLITFLPDGSIDPSSPLKVVFHHENGSALQVSLNEARLAYEILPYNANDGR